MCCHCIPCHVPCTRVHVCHCMVCYIFTIPWWLSLQKLNFYLSRLRFVNLQKPTILHVIIKQQFSILLIKPLQTYIPPYLLERNSPPKVVLSLLALVVCVLPFPRLLFSNQPVQSLWWFAIITKRSIFTSHNNANWQFKSNSATCTKHAIYI